MANKYAAAITIMLLIFTTLSIAVEVVAGLGIYLIPMIIAQILCVILVRVFFTFTRTGVLPLQPSTIDVLFGLIVILYGLSLFII